MIRLYNIGMYKIIKICAILIIYTVYEFRAVLRMLFERKKEDEWWERKREKKRNMQNVTSTNLLYAKNEINWYNIIINLVYIIYIYIYIYECKIKLLNVYRFELKYIFIILLHINVILPFFIIQVIFNWIDFNFQNSDRICFLWIILTHCFNY